MNSGVPSECVHLTLFECLQSQRSIHAYIVLKMNLRMITSIKYKLKLIGGGLLLLATLAASAAYPDRPIKLVVPFPAGGTVDVVARMTATQLAQLLSTPVVVENVPGAGGSLAAARVAKSPADGYTLLFTTPNHTINPALSASLPFETEKDFSPISLIAEIPELLVAHAGQPFNQFTEFVSYARSHPDRLNYASAGNGTLPHITMELLLQKLNLRVTHIPYKGAAPALSDLLSGVVSIKMDTIATSTQHIRSGKLKPLAIASLKRSPLMPQVPTISELGVPGYQGILWMGILVPSATDAAVQVTLAKAAQGLASQVSFQRQLEAEGVNLVAGTPASFAQLISAELVQWKDVVSKSGLKAN